MRTRCALMGKARGVRRGPPVRGSEGCSLREHTRGERGCGSVPGAGSVPSGAGARASTVMYKHREAGWVSRVLISPSVNSLGGFSLSTEAAGLPSLTPAHACQRRKRREFVES